MLRVSPLASSSPKPSDRRRLSRQSTVNAHRAAQPRPGARITERFANRNAARHSRTHSESIKQVREAPMIRSSMVAAAALSVLLTAACDKDNAADEQNKATTARNVATDKAAEATKEAEQKIRNAQAEADKKIAEAQAGFMKLRDRTRRWSGPRVFEEASISRGAVRTSSSSSSLAPSCPRGAPPTGRSRSPASCW